MKPREMLKEKRRHKMRSGSCFGLLLGRFRSSLSAYRVRRFNAKLDRAVAL